MAGLLVLAACESPSARRRPLPASPHVVAVEMRDYRFDYRAAIAGGRVLLRVRNRGSMAHSLSLIPLTDDIPPIDEQLRGSQRRTITPLVQVTLRQPGTRTSIAVDLVPGVRYAFVCFIRDADGQPHFLRGMSAEFRAGASPFPASSSTSVQSDRSSLKRPFVHRPPGVARLRLRPP